MKNRIKLLLTSILALMLFAGMTSHNLYKIED